MNDFAIRVEQLSKHYYMPPAEPTADSFASKFSRNLRRRLSGTPKDEEFWALRDVNFDVARGEVVGVIGHNGAGKSTLLKILARITNPTGGCVRVRGRMASLLEVGTGFHPDLSGRENVFMNAAILGMNRKEIRRRFTSIVEFSGIERFIDTPIKHYSSGMKVRLAFAVAAHLDPEILLLDEVLAVGDAAFQKKSLNRIEQVGSSGRTILFVSHQLPAVVRLCSRTILLDHGRVVFDGKTLEAIRQYSELRGGGRQYREWSEAEAPGDEVALLRTVQILRPSGPASGPLDVREPIGVRLHYSVQKSGRKITPSVHLFDSGGNWIFAALDIDPQWHDRPRPEGNYVTTAWIPGNLLNESDYAISVSIATLNPLRQHCFEHDCVGFTVFDSMEGDTARGVFPSDMPGMIRPMLRWETRRE